MKKKILILSDATWNVNNNVGNTLSNLFGNIKIYDYSMIYTKDTLPKNDICGEYLQVSEVNLLKSLINYTLPVTNIIDSNCSINSHLKNNSRIGILLYSFFKKRRMLIFLLLREFLWFIRRKKINQEIDFFLESTKPHILFFTPSQNIYMSKIYQHICLKYNIPAAMYFMDDVFEIYNKNINPIKVIYQNKIRKELLGSVKLSNLVFTIIDKQAKLYKEKFNITSNVLNKSSNLSLNAKSSMKNHIPIITYAGNLYAGRLKTLLSFCSMMNRINIGEIKYLIHIYSQDLLNAKTYKYISKLRGVVFKGSIEKIEVDRVLMNSDFLLHVESFESKFIRATSLSFSTKIVDYLYSGKPIIAIGDIRCASIEYLEKHQAAMTLLSKKFNSQLFEENLQDQNLHDKICKNSFNLAILNHNHSENIINFKNKLEDLLGDY
jgi:hypothetical protein